MSALTIVNTRHGKTCVKGVVKLYIEKGVPVGMTIEGLNEAGVHVSLLNLADQLQKADWPEDRIIAYLKEEYRFTPVEFDEQLAWDFLMSHYEYQRKMIFEYLWKDFEGNIFDEITKPLTSHP